MNSVVARPPIEFSELEINDFVALVMAGGEVAANGLRKRILNARCLAFLRKGECLVGVAGLKQPLPSYRTRVQKNSRFVLAQEAFPFELGWAFILPSARRRKLSFPLCQPVVAAAGEAGVFATSRADNVGMHSTLKKLGFVRAGSEWNSKTSGGNLQLFVKPPSRFLA